MRFLILPFVVLCGWTLIACNQGLSQNGNFPLSFHLIPISDPDLNKPGAGAEQWNDQNIVNIPDAAVEQCQTGCLLSFFVYGYCFILVLLNRMILHLLIDKSIDAIGQQAKLFIRIMQMCGGCSPVTRGG